MYCYLCNSNEFDKRDGVVRDASGIHILECKHCGLVCLDSKNHIKGDFYENSGMHGNAVPSIESWMKNTEWDDQRRFEMVKPLLPNKKILDFGCGAGGFIHKARVLASEVQGVELEARVIHHWNETISIKSSLDLVTDNNDLITAFHVIEHLPDPRAILQQLGAKLSRNGKMIVEVPNSDDALLTLYDCAAFRNFTYWSQHLFLFNASTLSQLAKQAGLQIVAVKQYQRYPLSNHLFWLSHGKLGGHEQWSFLNNTDLSSAYGRALSEIGKCDTLIAYLGKL